ncbi:MAG: DUF559 domain-containing protein, partial [Conexibacter sp.]
QIRTPHPDAIIAVLAGRQHGVVARRQLLAAGITPSMLNARLAAARLVRIHPGVYAPGHRHLRREGFWLAAVLAAGPAAVLSHRDAAALHAIRPANGTRIDVSTTAERCSTRTLRIHARRWLDADDVVAVEGIPVTTVERTLVDLAEVLDAAGLAKALSEAERANVLDVRRLAATLGRTRGRRGAGHRRIRAALDEHRHLGVTLTRSELEDRFLLALAAHGVPRPHMNRQIAGYEIDASWPQARLAVELDGFAHHRHRRAFARDRAKGNALARAGWTLLRFTHDDVVRRPAQVASSVVDMLPPRSSPS